MTGISCLLEQREKYPVKHKRFFLTETKAFSLKTGTVLKLEGLFTRDLENLLWNCPHFSMREQLQIYLLLLTIR